MRAKFQLLMKRNKSFFVLFFVALVVLMSACAPANPPKIEKSSIVIDLCYQAMGQSGEQLQKDLAAIGYDVPRLEPSAGYECYGIKTNAYDISFATIGDRVLIAHYETYFGGSPLLALTRHKDLSDHIFNLGWNNWKGSCHSGDSDNIDLRPQFWNQVMQDKQKNTEHHSGILERMAKPFGDQMLWADVHFYHIVTDKGIIVNFEINDHSWE